MNSIYITLKPLSARLGMSHRTLEKIIITEFKKGNKAPRYQLPHARSYLYIFEEFLPWFQQLLKSPENKNKTKPIDLFKHQKSVELSGHKPTNMVKNYVRI
jgi:hypothetical protein